MVDGAKLKDGQRRRTGFMLDDRKSAILAAVVEEYTETALPVGSVSVVASSEVNVSAATVRNDMAALEVDGYLEQPYTSAGRVPTEKGYRYFVDRLEGMNLLLPDGHRVQDFFGHIRGEIEQVMQETAGLLSAMTDYAAVVVDETDESSKVLSVQLVPLNPDELVAVAVSETGHVHKQRVRLHQPLPESKLDEIQTIVTTNFQGRKVTKPASPAATGDPIVDHCVTEILQAFRDENEAGKVYVDGASRVASAFEAVDSVQQVLTILEQQLVVVSLLADVVGRGLTVAIGTETGVAPLAECSLVVSPYQVDGKPAGSIAVLGPTRMKYPQAMSAVAAISRQLGTRLSEG